MWAFFALSMVVICTSIVLLIRKFAAKNVELVVRMATMFAWLTAMMVIALVPLDVWATYIQSDSTKAILILWHIAYWSTQFATWLVMPFYQVYSEAGDFTVKSRAWTSLKENGLLLGTIGSLGAIGILVVLVYSGANYMALLDIGIFASNAFGLIAGLLLMGYGLVEIPRSLWLTSSPETMLKWCAHRCGKFAEAVMRSTSELETVATIIHANQKQMRRHDPLRPFMEIIADQAERDSPIKPSDIARRNVDLEVLKAEDLEYNYEEKGLAELRRRMFKAVSGYQGARAQYDQYMQDAFELEDVVKCRSLREYEPRVPEGSQPSQLARYLWLYKCVARPYAHKVYAVLLGITSCCIIWGELTIPFKNVDLSPFSHMLQGIGPERQFIFQAMTLLPLVYMSVCSYYALFKLNAFNYNKLIPGATTGTALMQNGSLMCRFAAPTCWNFYHIIRFANEYCNPDDAASAQCHHTVFSTIMDTMANIDMFKYIKINTYLPGVLVVHCAMVALGVWDRIFIMCVPQRLRFSTDNVDDEYTEKGRLLIRKEQEATSRGFGIGEVLHSAYFDLEFPTIANFGRQGIEKKKSFFGSLFGKKQGAPPAARASSSASGPSAATAAAARWLRGGNAAEGGDERTSLLSGQPYESAGPATTPGTSKAGLDGLFADLGSRYSSSGAAAGRAGGAAAAAAAAPPPGPRLVFGTKEEVVSRESDSLLGFWNRGG